MSQLQRALIELLPSVQSVVETAAVGGGCISDAQRVRYRDHHGDLHQVFVKSNRPSFLENFQAEWDGLVRLGQPGAISVPRPLAVGVAADHAWLVIDWVDQGARGADYFSEFGCQLAQLHRSTLGDQIGLDRDNFLGSAPQANSPSDSWVDFVAERRIGYQIGWARDQGLADSRLCQDCGRIVNSMDQLLAGREDRTSLLHGDLWSGNYLCDADGRVVLIDPAVYYGCREAEFGMLRLFGSCPAEFYDSYEQTYPMPGGWQRRVSVYVLYHLLNHLNLFGRGYHDQCASLAAEILRA